MENLIISSICLLFALFVNFFIIKYWIDIAKKSESMLVPDMNKYKKPLIPKTGGIAVMVSTILAIFIYIFFKTFVLQTTTHFAEVLALIVVLLLAGLIGFIDDIFGWRKSLTGKQKILMTIPIAIPLMVINAGHSIMSIPFIGAVDFGLIYPIVIIPLGVIGATNGYNLLAGHNGLEAGLGIIIFSVLSIVAFLQNQYWLALIGGIFLISLLVFYFFNQFPAKIFPGNSLTYIVGALIACFAILGNMEKVAFLLFIPFIIEGILKARSKFKADNFGKPNKENNLRLPYRKIYSLTHLVMKILKKIKPSHKVYEREVVNVLLVMELILAIIVLICVF